MSSEESRQNLVCGRFDVFVCVEKHNLLEAVVASVATISHRLRRTQRLKISHFQRFNVNIGRYFSMAPPEGLAIPKHTLFFEDGYHRCAFLTAIYKRLIKYFSNQLKKVNVSALGFELEQMCKEYDHDFRRLGNDDFFSLLKHSASSRFI